MPDLPSASTTISDDGPAAAGDGFCAVIAPVGTAADTTPRVYRSWAALKTQHGYCQGVDYAALHIEETGEPVLFVGIPIVTAGTIGRKDSTGNSGTSVITLSGAPLDETDGELKVLTGGTIGTDEILLSLSLDGGRTTKRVRLGTANSYVIPDVGVTISFAAGTLVTGDTAYTWTTDAPMYDAAGLTAARNALAAQQKNVRTWMVIGDLTANAEGDAIVTEANAYETSVDRFVLARAGVRDRLPLATLSQETFRMTGNPNVTFAEVGATGDTITRSAGSWIDDGFAVGQILTIAGSSSNNGTHDATIAGVTATVITLDTDDLVDEGPVGNVTITATPSLTFAEVGATGDTITRAGGGSFLDDGFRVGDLINITGTASNNITGAAGVTGVSATVITFDTDDLVDEVIGATELTSMSAGETHAQHVATMDALFADIEDEKRVSFSLGRGFKKSPILGYELRRPACWAASVREYQHDVHISTMRKSDGSLSGWDLKDTAGNIVEYDERVNGGALDGRFTCLRTWANSTGAYVALDLTRGDENSLLSRAHNMEVANIAQQVVQEETENAIGQGLLLNDDGTATTDSLNKIAERVNAGLQIALLQDKGEGQRASSAVWTPATDDDLSVVGAQLNGSVALNLRGTIEKVSTTVRVQSG